MRIQVISCVLYLLFTLGMLGLADSKIIRTETKFSSFVKHRYKHVGKFGFSIGRGKYTFKAKLKNDARSKHHQSHILLNLIGFIDEDYERMEKIADCHEKVRSARLNREFNLPVDGSDIDPIYGEVLQTSRTRVWHFMVCDCNYAFPDIKDNLNEIQFVLEILNSDGSSLSEEERGLFLPHLIMTGVFLAFFWANLREILKYYRRESEIDYPLVLLDIACLTEFLALVFETLYLYTSMKYGEPSFGLDFYSTTFSITAQFVMTSLLILIASGWTISYSNVEDLDLVIPIGILITILHVIFAAIGMIDEQDPLKTHDYDHWTGIVLIVFKIVFFAVFIGFSLDTYRNAQNKLKPFLLKLMVIGAVYLLTIPVEVCISTIFVDHLWRHYVITLGNMILQSSAVLLFAFQFSAKGSAYNSVSLKGGIVLPTNKFD